jgi:hypothetical protein
MIKYNNSIKENFTKEESNVNKKLENSNYKPSVLTKEKLRNQIRDVDLKIQ